MEKYHIRCCFDRKPCDLKPLVIAKTGESWWEEGDKHFPNLWAPISEMKYIENWLSGLGLSYITPKLKANGITTPKKLALLSLRDIYEVVGVEDAEDRKKLYFLIQRLQTVSELRGMQWTDQVFNLFIHWSLSFSRLTYIRNIQKRTYTTLFYL